MNHKFISLNFLLFFSLVVISCKKNELRSSADATNSVSAAEIQPLKPHYVDTVSVAGKTITSLEQSPGKQVSTFGIFSVSPPNTKIIIQYTGNQTYHFQVYNNLTKSNYTCNYHIYKDGIKVNGYTNPVRSQNDDKIDFDIKPVVGTYTLRIEYVSAPRGVPAFNLINYVIYPVPSVPAGKLPLLRYYNPQTGKHIFSNNWEELASGKDGFFFEKVQGWLNSGPGTNLAVFTRYYNPNNGDHYNSFSTGPVLGYTKEGPLGYLATVSGQDMNLPLIQYNSQTTGHTYVSPPETLQADNVYEGVIGYMSVNTWAAYPDEGDIIRNDDTGEISLFIEGKLRHIPTSDILHTLFAYTDLLLKHYSAVQLANYQIPMGTPIALDNSLIRDTNNQYIYLREGNYIRHIESIEAMRRYHFNETIAGNVNGVANYTVGPDIKWLYVRDL